MTTKTRNALVCVACSCLFVHCTRPRSGDVNAPLAIEALPSPAGENSSEPQLTVNGGHAILSWIETVGSNAALKFSERTESGWTPPRTAANGSDWFLSWADVPTVARLDDGTLVAQWLRELDPAEEAYEVRLAFSRDEGRTWSAPVSPHHDGTKTQHGFVSLFQMPGSGLGLVWLDGRDGETMTLRSAAFDRDGTQVGETLVDSRVCECCPTAVAVTADGPVAAFRDRSGSEVRDISTSRLVNGAWTGSTTVHADGWVINACPVNGPAIAARERDVAVAWFTAKEDQGQAFAAFSSDAGATFGAPIRLDDGSSLGRVAVAMTDGGAVATWIEFANGRAELKARRIDPSGARGPAQTVAGISRDRASGNARLARRGGELLFAWTETSDGRAQVKTATARTN